MRYGGILVKSTIRREGIGSVLIGQCKKIYKNLKVNLAEDDDICIKFFNKNGFKVIQDDEGKSNSTITMEWNKNEKSKAKLVYFDNDIEQKYLNKSLGYTYESINIHNFLEKEGIENYQITNIKSYMKLRKDIENIMNSENIILYIDYNNYNSFVDEQIKEIVKIKRINLNVVICEPFTIENAKKEEIIKKIEKSYRAYNIIKINCSFDNSEEDIPLNQIFQKRAEILVEKIKDIAENM